MVDFDAAVAYACTSRAALRAALVAATRYRVYGLPRDAARTAVLQRGPTGRVTLFDFGGVLCRELDNVVVAGVKDHAASTCFQESL